MGQDAPEEVVERYFERLKTGNYDQNGELIHPVELRLLQEMMTPVVAKALATPSQAGAFSLFADPSDSQKVKVLSAEEFFNTFMLWIQKMDPGYADMLSSASFKTLGHVIEKDKQHVVVRLVISQGGMKIEKMLVLTVMDSNGENKMLLPDDMRSFAESLQNM